MLLPIQIGRKCYKPGNYQLEKGGRLTRTTKSLEIFCHRFERIASVRLQNFLTISALNTAALKLACERRCYLQQKIAFPHIQLGSAMLNKPRYARLFSYKDGLLKRICVF